MNAHGTYAVKSWDEKTYDQVSPKSKLTKATVEYEFTGEIAGKGMVEYLMFYDYSDPNDPHKSSASYIGLMKFTGLISGREGGFMMQDSGTFRNGVASSTLAILLNSGSGALKGIRGTGRYRASQQRLEFELDYDFSI
ncbi:MAG TPA: DUF3224 domain-containing protein [Bacteroidota bacterium]|nr:DUF3224 domain-containing protein [Bacteroidota bacterium]